MKLKKLKKLKIGKLSNIIILIFGLLLSGGYISAQTQQTEILAPADEEFREVYGVITQGSSLPGRRASEFSKLDIYRIYNDDKTIWYEFSFGKESPVFFVNNKNPDFKPFVPFSWAWLYMRVVGESENWYKVVVNEEIEETKYILKSDRVYGYATFEYYLDKSGFITFDGEKNVLRETPNGKPADVKYIPGRYNIKKIEGEWMDVRGKEESQIEGWIRWRKDGKVLVGYTLNKYEVPEQ